MKVSRTQSGSKWHKAFKVAGIAALILAGQLLLLRGFQQQHSRVLVYKSTVLMQKNANPAVAETLAAQAVALNGYDGYARFNHGTALYIQQVFPEAAEAFKQAIPVLPHAFNAVRLLAFSQYEMKDFTAASKSFRDYLATIPNPPVSPDLIFERAGTSELRLGNVENASLDLLSATPLLQKKSDNLRMRIMTAVLANRPGTALYCTHLFRFYVPGTELNAFDMLLNALKAEKLPQAITFLEAILPMSTEDLSVAKVLAAAYMRVPDEQRAVALIRREIEKHPQDASLRLVLGDIYYTQKNLPGAFEQYDEHLRLLPNSSYRVDIDKKRRAVLEGS